MNFFQIDNLILLMKKYRNSFFYMGYTLFFLSWLCHDVSSTVIDVFVVGKILRTIAYVLFIIEIPFLRRTKKEWLYFIFGFLISLYIVIGTHEIFFSVLLLMIFLSIDIDLKKIIKLSFNILFISTIVVVILSFCNITQNVISPRGIGGDYRVRNSFGFYHSNVLPLNVFYLLCVYILLKKDKVSNKFLLLFFIVSSFIYYLCLSRNSYLFSIILIILAYILKKVTISDRILKYLEILASNIILIFTSLSLILTFLLENKNNIITFIDSHFLSGRITYSLLKIQSTGISFFKPLNYSEYTQDLIVVDNGYISTLIRYGLLFVIFICIFNYFGLKKYNKNPYILITVIIIGIANFIDNDLFSYCCYFLWMGVFNRNDNIKRIISEPLKENDLVSVIMSVYNENNTELKNSINSILNQTYKNLEFIIINDNPNNNEILKTINYYKDQDTRIKVVINSKNLGLVNSLNIGLKYCNGEYIARMDADDISLPTRIEHQLKYIKDNNYDFIGSYIELIDEDGSLLNKKMIFPINPFSINLSLKFGSCLPHPTWLAKKEVFKELNGYRNIPFCEDYDFILRARQKKFKFGNLPETSLYYRIRKNGISESNKLEQKILRYYLSDNRNEILDIDIDNLKDFIQFERKEKYDIYENYKKEFKQSLKSKKLILATSNFIKLINYKIFYKELTDKVRNVLSS